MDHASPRALLPVITVHPNNGYVVYFQELFYPASYVEFTGLDAPYPGSVFSNIPALGCSWTWAGVLPIASYTVNGYAACTASVLGVIATSIQGCVQSYCANGSGSLVVQTPPST